MFKKVSQGELLQEAQIEIRRLRGLVGEFPSPGGPDAEEQKPTMADKIVSHDEIIEILLGVD